jgi:hypothetical protein
MPATMIHATLPLSNLTNAEHRQRALHVTRAAHATHCPRLYGLASPAARKSLSFSSSPCARKGDVEHRTHVVPGTGRPPCRVRKGS